MNRPSRFWERAVAVLGLLGLGIYMGLLGLAVVTPTDASDDAAPVAEATAEPCRVSVELFADLYITHYPGS